MVPVHSSDALSKPDREGLKDLTSRLLCAFFCVTSTNFIFLGVNHAHWPIAPYWGNFLPIRFRKQNTVDISDNYSGY